MLRDNGEVDAALVALRRGLRAAAASDDPGRDADVRATLGATLVAAGRTAQGLRHLDDAVGTSSGPLQARVRVRRAYALGRVGRHDDALDDLRHAVACFRESGDRLWEARALTTRARSHLARGSVPRAEQDASLAAVLFASTGADLDAADAVHNRGALAFLAGDLPTALALLDEAQERYDVLGSTSADLAHDRCEVLLAAGLADDALEVADRALGAGSPSPVERAHLELVAAGAALALGDPDGALARGRTARTRFRRQQREWWALQADLVLLQARWAQGDHGSRAAAEARRVATGLADLGAPEAPLALLLAGRLADDRASAAGHLAAAARHRHHGSALVAATGWLALALARAAGAEDTADTADTEGTGTADPGGASRGVLTACGRGLDALDEHRATLGSSELRALSTRHGADLAALALREAAAGGSPRRLLSWSERWRATALAQPPVRPPAEAADDLAALRLAVHRLEELRREGAGPEADLGRRELEREVRRRRHRLAGHREPTPRLDLDELVAALGETSLVELVDVDGTLHALVVRAGRVRGFVVGPTEAATAAVGAARFVLRQTGRGRPADPSGVGARLESALLGPAARSLGAGPVVVSPPGRLHATPWGLLPSLADRPVTASPSAAAWLRAARRTRPDHDGVVLVSGPGLGTGGAEVPLLADDRPGASVLRGPDATVGAVLAALDGAWIAHVAAHGHFRPDSPMFSSLVLADGPLTVHDLELLHRAPYRLVLSACDSGVMAPVGADELLGLSAALLSLGTAGVVSAVAPVNDEATADLMVVLHRALATGAGLGEALHDVRRSARGDAVAGATAAAFVGLGV